MSISKQFLGKNYCAPGPAPDHTVPLEWSGADDPSNMSGIHKSTHNIMIESSRAQALDNQETYDGAFARHVPQHRFFWTAL
jgi:hypothetical protein